MWPFDYILSMCILVCLSLSFYTIRLYKQTEKKYFNGGICFDCNIPLKSLNEKGAMIRMYHCSHCFSTIPVFFSIDKKVNVHQQDLSSEEPEDNKEDT
jgi:hypothetical protein